MPYKDREKAAEYSRNHQAINQRNQNAKQKRRMTEARILLGGRCVRCLAEGVITTEDLQFDHIDPSTKLWNITDGARRAREEIFWLEVAKCQLLCQPHHTEKTKADGGAPQWYKRGSDHPKAKLCDQDVRSIRALAKLGFDDREIAKLFDLHRGTVYQIRTGRKWTHVL